ncbi:hypothetical protein ACHAWF_009848 [Thalassiosira exigua]
MVISHAGATNLLLTGWKTWPKSKCVRPSESTIYLLELEWRRKPSGSQLHLTLRGHDSTVAVRIAESLNRWDYVEYVYALLGSFPISKSDGKDQREGLLRQIEHVASGIPQSSVEFCKRLCDAATEGKSPDDVGLGGLPGLLFPTPEVSQSSPSCMQTESYCGKNFDVNTICTKPNVAEAVVKAISHHIDCQYTSDTLWVGAGSGNGALLKHVPSKYSIGVDTNPTSPVVRQMGFLEDMSPSWLRKEFPHYERFVVVSNPSFSSSSRGDYTPLVRFINHSFHVLGAGIVAAICPNKFARERIWISLGITANASLSGRFFLPPDAFYNPATGESVHIHSYCLIFEQKDKQSTDKADATIMSKRGVYLSAKRDKGAFRTISTSDLASSIVLGLTKAGIELVPERNARYMLNAKLTDSASLELWWSINPQLPCSLINCNSAKVSNHSLGWLSLSTKPPIALAMASRTLNGECSDNGKNQLAANLMSGEGTIELEASRAVSHPVFFISGDKSKINAIKTAGRIQTCQSSSCQHALVDVVLWDAQNLPLRSGIADAVFADLPFQGGIKQVHQSPQIGNVQYETATSTTMPPLSYRRVLKEACRIAKVNGCAALLSLDGKALRHAYGLFNWSQLGFSSNLNLGGLNGKLFLMKRKQACTKDVSVWVASPANLSSWILEISRNVCIEYERSQGQTHRVNDVRLLSTFFHEKKQSLSHCYRITFDDMVKNAEAKNLEQLIRKQMENEELVDIKLR